MQRDVSMGLKDRGGERIERDRIFRQSPAISHHASVTSARRSVHEQLMRSRDSKLKKKKMLCCNHKHSAYIT